MQLLDAMHWRYAVKRFTEHRLPPERIHTLLEATRLAPSAYGLQPYHLMVVDDPDLRERLLEHAYGQEKILHSSLLLVLAAREDLDREFIDQHLARMARLRPLSDSAMAGMRRHYHEALVEGQDPQQRRLWAREQAWIAFGTLLTAAALMQIDACPMTGIDADGFDAVLGLSARGLNTVAVCTLGSRHPQDEHATLAKVRLAFDEFVIGNDQ